jgi:hypothetical protein
MVLPIGVKMINALSNNTPTKLDQAVKQIHNDNYQGAVVLLDAFLRENSQTHFPFSKPRTQLTVAQTLRASCLRELEPTKPKVPALRLGDSARWGHALLADDAAQTSNASTACSSPVLATPPMESRFPDPSYTEIIDVAAYGTPPESQSSAKEAQSQNGRPDARRSIAWSGLTDRPLSPISEESVEGLSTHQSGLRAPWPEMQPHPRLSVPASTQSTGNSHTSSMFDRITYEMGSSTPATSIRQSALSTLSWVTDSSESSFGNAVGINVSVRDVESPTEEQERPESPWGRYHAVVHSYDVGPTQTQTPGAGPSSLLAPASQTVNSTRFMTPSASLVSNLSAASDTSSSVDFHQETPAICTAVIGHFVEGALVPEQSTQRPYPRTNRF